MNLTLNIKGIETKVGESVTRFEGATIEITDLSLKEYAELLMTQNSIAKDFLAGVPDSIRDIGLAIAYVKERMAEADLSIQEALHAFQEQFGDEVPAFMKDIMNDIVAKHEGEPEHNPSSDDPFADEYTADVPVAKTQKSNFFDNSDDFNPTPMDSRPLTEDEKAQIRAEEAQSELQDEIDLDELPLSPNEHKNN